SAPTYLHLAGTHTTGVTGPGSSLLLRAWGRLTVDAGVGTPWLSVRMGDAYLQTALGEVASSGLWRAELLASRNPNSWSQEMRGLLTIFVTSATGSRTVQVEGVDTWTDASMNFVAVSARWADPVSPDRVLTLR